MMLRLHALAWALAALLSCSGSPGQEPKGQLVDVGGHRLYIECSGTGSPAVVFDTGLASRSDEWRVMRETIGRTTRACTYDRAGYGQSEMGPAPRHGQRLADELRTLLRKASVPGPYVLVGHSLGGLNLQIYAAGHPDEVAALVLLDPPPLAWLTGTAYAELRQLAEGMTREWTKQAEALLNSASPAEKAQGAFFRTIGSEHAEMFGESARAASAIRSFGDVPLTVIASGKPNPRFGAVAEDYQRFWVDQSRLLAGKSSAGRFLVAPESSHNLHLDAAQLVEAEILRAVSGGRTGKSS